MKNFNLIRALIALVVMVGAVPALAHIGDRSPSERRVVPDPITGVPLLFLTSGPGGDSKIYQTHPQWTADGKWVIFRSNRVAHQAFAVNEASGDIVQVTETGFSGMLSFPVDHIDQAARRQQHHQAGDGGAFHFGQPAFQ